MSIFLKALDKQELVHRIINSISKHFGEPIQDIALRTGTLFVISLGFRLSGLFSQEAITTQLLLSAICD
jgi:hypothetical protein